MKLTSMLVGAHFRPPAKTILEHLPAGAFLRLVREPDNEYDSNAIRVEVGPSAIPKSEWEGLELSLANFGATLPDVLEVESIHLGYVAASSNKKVALAGYNGNTDFLEAQATWPALGRLAFDLEGKPLVVLDTESQLANEANNQGVAE